MAKTRTFKSTIRGTIAINLADGSVLRVAKKGTIHVTDEDIAHHSQLLNASTDPFRNGRLIEDTDGEGASPAPDPQPADPPEPKPEPATGSPEPKPEPEPEPEPAPEPGASGAITKKDVDEILDAHHATAKSRINKITQVPFLKHLLNEARSRGQSDSRIKVITDRLTALAEAETAHTEAKARLDAEPRRPVGPGGPLAQVR